MSLKPEDILSALREVIDPELQEDIVSLGFIKDLVIKDGRVSFTLELTTPACPLREHIRSQALNSLNRLPGVKDVDIKLGARVRNSFSEREEVSLLANVKNVVAIASGKGGVGKSTVSVNLALALSKSGAKVGLMDADVYGPSVPAIFGVKDVPQPTCSQRISPALHHGLKVMSIGFFLKPDDAVVWRGPMLHKTIEQFLYDVDWGELDYLIIDLPPGTGDVQISLCQIIPLSGAVIVTTPQDVALNIAAKAVSMFNKLNAPVIGFIENMSSYKCSKCGHQDDIFGKGGARRAAKEMDVEFLGEIPLDSQIRKASDEGIPVLIQDPGSSMSGVFDAIANKLAASLSVRAVKTAQEARAS